MTEPGNFTALWASYPRRIAKKDAEKAYNQALKRGVTHEAIMASLAIMQATEWRGRERQYLPYPASFLRGEAFERVEAVEDELEFETGEHNCTTCRVSHVWTHECTVNCTGRDQTCPEERLAMQKARGK